MRSGVSELYEGRQQAPLERTGTMFSVEAGVVFPGEANFQFELGVRGRSLLEQASLLRRSFVVRSVGVTGGARGRLSVLPIELGLVPIMTGGLEISTTRDRLMLGGYEERLGIGPHLALGVEKRFSMMTLSFLLDARAEVVPASFELGFALEVRVP